ncbi:MAG: hypothetical protein H7327_11755 [Herminiimonas sp.]|nr:hypothetical protein [Herminiimonas sp.]
MDRHEHLGKEWQTLQGNYEQYEKMALAIKVLATTLCFITFALPIDVLLSCAVLMVLWIQEATVRTSQARLGVRLLQVEALLQQSARPSGSATGTGDAAYGLHTHWVATRPGTLGLLSEYLANAQRPTVAFPYIVLLLLLVGEWWILPG